MGTQQFLTIGGIIIFTFMTLTFNSSVLNQSSASYFNEAIIVAAGLGQSMIEEIHTRAFDENTTINAVDTIINLTQPYSLGYDTGEGLKNLLGYAKTHGYDASTSFDDIDDYNGFSRDYSDKILGNFNSKVEVYYIKPSSPNQKSTIRTFAKRVDVTMSNPYLTINENDSTGTLKLTSIITY